MDKKILGLFLIFIFLTTTVSAISFVRPLVNAEDGQVDEFLQLIPNKVYEVSFLAKDEGLEILSASVKCDEIVCGSVKKDGPYFKFDVFKENNVNELIELNFEYKDLQTNETSSKSIFLETEISYDFLQVKALIKSNLEYLEDNEVSVLVENKSMIDKNFYVVLEIPFSDNLKEKITLNPNEKKVIDFHFELLKKGESTIKVFKEVDNKTILVSEENIEGISDTKDIYREGFFSFLVINPQLNIFNYLKSFFLFFI